MGQAKLRQRVAFPPPLVAEWEADLCVNFAVALARLTGWLLHVDWWVPSTDPDADIPIERMRPPRVYVADNHEQVFDIGGTRSVDDFNRRTIHPLATRHGGGAVRTRFYAEDALATLPLKAKPDEAKILAASRAIEQNAGYFEAVPRRPPGGIPSYEAARFTFGRCAPFTEALRDLTGLPAVGLIADRYTPQYAKNGKVGYVHSLILHPDGMAQDAWGLAPIAEIARRFHLAEFHLSAEEHLRVVGNLRRNTPVRYDEAFADAKRLLMALSPSPAA